MWLTQNGRLSYILNSIVRETGFPIEFKDKDVMCEYKYMGVSVTGFARA